MVDFDAFHAWAMSRFNGDVKVSGDEIRMNSIFDPDGNDEKHKLYCNVAGGKHDREDGVYKCWISGKIGTLVGLVMSVDHCSPEEAKDLIGVKSDLATLEEELKNVFRTKKPTTPEDIAEVEEKKPLLELPENCILISEMSRINRNRKKAESYLDNRKIPIDGLFICVAGDFRDRIIIPYYNPNGDLVYFNGRYIGTNEKVVKYLGPDKDKGVGKGDVLYCPEFPPSGSKLYVTEGEFDALTLHLCGFSGASVGGSNLTDKQIRLMRPFRIVLSVDNDGAGKNALIRMASILSANGINKYSYIRPPVGFKDWNSLYQKKDKSKVASYIQRCEKPFREEDAILLM